MSWFPIPIPVLADCNASHINYAGRVTDHEFFAFEEDVCSTTILDAITLDVVGAIILAPAEACQFIGGRAQSMANNEAEEEALDCFQRCPDANAKPDERAGPTLKDQG
jgi:hypothetical protein